MYNYFNFRDFGQYVLITNDFGQYAFLTQDNFKRLVKGELSVDNECYEELSEKLFLVGNNKDIYVNRAYEYARLGKKYLFTGTTLFIFVVTTWCNANCVYCQAKDNDSKVGYMLVETALKAVDIALSSTADNITIEFQGGEPLGNFEVISSVVLYAKEKAIKLNKQVEFSLVSNLSLINDNIISFIKEHNIALSTSIDGDKQLHNCNRPLRNGNGSFDYVANGLLKAKEAGICVGAIQTTTRNSLTQAQSIIDTYLKYNMDMIFIRPLTPLGMASLQWKDIGYLPEEFLRFYQECIDYLLYINKTGKYIAEGHASILLSKILFGEGLNYMELRSPCGATIGQMAFYCDGKVYTCDEARMLAEMGNDMFLLGTVDDTYNKLVDTPVCKAACASSLLECIPECCDCVYQPYCGQCPVVNLALGGDIFPREARSYRCQIYQGILDILFSILYKNDPQDLQILRSWVRKELQ